MTLLAKRINPRKTGNNESQTDQNVGILRAGFTDGFVWLPA